MDRWKVWWVGRMQVDPSNTVVIVFKKLYQTNVATTNTPNFCYHLTIKVEHKTFLRFC